MTTRGLFCFEIKSKVISTVINFILNNTLALYKKRIQGKLVMMFKTYDSPKYLEHIKLILSLS